MVFEMDEIKKYENQLKGKSILFLMPSLSAGGAERVIITIIKYLNKTKYKPVLVILNEGKNPLDLNELKCQVELINLNVSKARYAALAIYKVIKQKNPDTVLSTLGYVNEILSFLIPFLPKSIKFIARESSIPSKRNAINENQKIHDWIYRRFIKRFDLIICQSQEMYDDLKSEYRFDSSKMVIIDNPLDEKYILTKSKEECFELDKTNYNVLAVGSLKPVKNYELLLKESVKAPEHYQYFIIGEGVERFRLTSLIQKMKLENKVHLLGHQTNPWKFMSRANEFWQKSQFEGNSNALKEWNYLSSQKSK